VMFNQRFYPLLQHARALVRQGDLGTIHTVHGGFWQDWLLYETDYNWRLEPSEGGTLRAIGDIGSHWLDVAQFVTGRRVQTVLADVATVLPVRQKPAQAIQTFSTAQVERTPVKIETEDAATVMLRLEDGIRGVMQVSQVSAGRKNHMTLEVNGSRGSLAWDAERPNELWLGHRDRPNEILIKDPSLMAASARSVARYPGGHDEGYADTLTAAERAIYSFIRSGGYGSGGDPDFATFAAGHRENVIGDSILRSVHEERWIDVPPTPEA